MHGVVELLCAHGNNKALINLWFWDILCCCLYVCFAWNYIVISAIFSLEHAGFGLKVEIDYILGPLSLDSGVLQELIPPIV